MYYRIEEDVVVECSTSHAQKVSQGRTEIKVGVGIYILQETLRYALHTKQYTCSQDAMKVCTKMAGLTCVLTRVWHDGVTLGSVAIAAAVNKLAIPGACPLFCCFVLGRKPSCRLMRPCDFVVSQTAGHVTGWVGP